MWPLSCKVHIYNYFPNFNSFVLNKSFIDKVHIVYWQANDQKTKVDMINNFIN